MVYSAESIYRFRLLAKSTELGKRTNNIELLKQIKRVRRNTSLQQGFGIAAFSTAIIAIGIFYAPSVNYDQALNRFFISLAMVPVVIVFGITSIVNNGLKKRATRELTLMYNKAMN